jgi:transposase/transposase-like protein
MMTMLAADPLVMSEEDREALELMARSPSLAHRTVLRAKALLLAADGVAIYETARQVGVSSNSVRSWRRRFESEGLAGVGKIAKGRGRRSWVAADIEDAVVNDTLHVRPDEGSTQWSTRTMAVRHGIGKDTVARIWRKHDLKPWRIDTFKVSNDPNFEAKLIDVVGLYLDPPAKAVVFSYDEKTQVQALDRTQPSLPMKRGRAGTMTHDYKRNGTTDLFAAMNVATGEVLYDTRKSHSSKDVLAFFKLIDLHVAMDLDIHVVLDNLSAHKAPPVAEWLAHPKRARWHLHFTLTSSSWLNLVEGWFSLLTKKRLQRGIFNSIDALTEAIETWTEHWNDDPHPFIWTKTAEAILSKQRRARAALPASANSATHH